MAAGVSNDEMASLAVEVSANITNATKELKKIVGIAQQTARETEKAQVGANDNVARSYTKLASTADRANRAMGGSAANLSAQFQDIGVQLQSGTSAMTVALQQGTQIGAVLQQASQAGTGVGAALVGAFKSVFSLANAIPIAIIAIGGALIQSMGTGKKSVEDTVKALKDLDEIAKSIGATDLHLTLTAEIDEQNIQQAVGKLQERLQSEFDKLAGNKSLGTKAFENITKTWDDLVKSGFFDPTVDVGHIVNPLDNVKAAIRDLSAEATRSQLPTLIEQVNQLNELQIKLVDQRDRQDAQGMVETVEHMQAIITGLSSVDIPAVRDAMQSVRSTMDRFSTELAKTAKNAGNIGTAMRDADKLSAAAQEQTKQYGQAMQALQKFSEKHLTDVEKLQQAWEKADAGAQNYAEHAAAATAKAAGNTELTNEALQEANKGTAAFITKWEGFQPTAKWDVNAFRVGFGSDKFVDEAGKVQDVVASTTVTIQQAQADLARRIPEFQAIVMRSLGSEFWNKLSEDQQTALTSLVYNYGHVPKAIVEAIRKGGGAEEIAGAIAGLNTKPGTVNFDRRQSEAALFGGDRFKATQQAQEEVAASQLLVATTKEEIAIRADNSRSIEDQQGAIARLRAEKETEAKLTKEHGELTAADNELIRQAGQAAYENAAAIAHETEAKRNAKVWTDALKAAEKDSNKSKDQADKANQKLIDSYMQLGQQAVSSFVQALRNGESAGDAFLKMLDTIIDGLINMAIQALFSKNALGGVFSALGGPAGGLSQGGRVGYAGNTRPGKLSPFAFAGAPRMATGGFVGVKPGEYPTILHRGEVVLPASAVRRAGIGPFSSGGGGNTTVNNKLGNINIDMGSGAVAADSRKAREFGRQVRMLVQTEMTRQSQPGGMLTATGSAGRVGR